MMGVALRRRGEGVATRRVSAVGGHRQASTLNSSDLRTMAACAARTHPGNLHRLARIAGVSVMTGKRPTALDGSPKSVGA
jgi:hypothetical protein